MTEEESMVIRSYPLDTKMSVVPDLIGDPEPKPSNKECLVKPTRERG